MAAYFNFREGLYEALRRFPDDATRGRFVMGLCAFAFEGAEPDLGGSPEAEIAFSCVREQVEQQMATSARSAAAGSRGGRPR